MLRIGKECRQEIAALLDQALEFDGFPAVGRQARDRIAKARHQNDAVAAPGAPRSPVDVGEYANRPAVNFDPLQLVVGEKADGPTVRRPERVRGAVGSIQRPRRRRIERAHPQA